MKTYIALPGGWFEPGLPCELIKNCQDCGGIFSGIRVSKQGSEVNAGHELGIPYMDEELCPWDEFEIVEDNK